MSDIRILPEILSNQIAAGEVVQRPASVVKELLENCLDADATNITIEIARGGKSLIRVSDNGSGMSKDNALLSIERYATSKIYTKEDLFSISTMGFRGEALPSIASVSKFVLVTRQKDSDIATRIEIAGGRIVDVSDFGAPVGTMIEVKSLFYNTPARKKFLKADNTEYSHIADLISGMALAHPKTGFRFFSNDRLQKNYSSGDSPLQRAVNVLGKEVAKKLYEINLQNDYIKVTGFAASPEITRSTSMKIYLFANKRLIRDRGLISAIFRGYAGRIMKQRFPYAVLFISLAPDQIDVNVHPAKREVKFVDHQSVYHSLITAINSALLANEKRVMEKINKPLKHDETRSLYKEKLKGKYETGFNVFKDSSDQINNAINPDICSEEIPDYEVKQTSLPFKSKKESARREQPDHEFYVKQEFHEPVQDKGLARDDLVVIGQVLGTYIIAQSDNSMVLIDQHAAHERIVYEKLKTKFNFQKIITQDLLVPETFELGFKEADLLLRIKESLASLGMIIEPFGGQTFVIKSVPAIIDQKDIKEIVIEILENMIENKDQFATDNWLDECLILMACHNSIRARKSLNKTEMEKLVDDLKTCKNSMHCPHGRPVIIKWDRAMIEKLFKRVV